MIDKKGEKHLSWGDQEDLFSEDKDIPFSRVQVKQREGRWYNRNESNYDLDLSCWYSCAWFGLVDSGSVELSKDCNFAFYISSLFDYHILLRLF